MLPFTVTIQTGLPAYEQVVFAAKRAVATGVLKPGDRFPSVRSISKELVINPNTAHKVVAQLKQEGILEVVPGVGTIVSETAAIDRDQATEELRQSVERLVVEASQRSLGIEDLNQLIAEEFAKISKNR